jgi:hypothetical protein
MMTDSAGSRRIVVLPKAGASTSAHNTQGVEVQLRILSLTLLLHPDSKQCYQMIDLESPRTGKKSLFATSAGILLEVTLFRTHQTSWLVGSQIIAGVFSLTPCPEFWPLASDRAP